MARYSQDTSPKASDIPFAPAGNLTSDNAQAAIEELDATKAGYADVDPAVAAESEGDITLDVQGSTEHKRLVFEHTMTGNQTLLDPVDMPDGATILLLINPDSNTLSFDTGYEGVDDDLPDVTEETLLGIVRIGTRYLVHVSGKNYGNGA